MYFCTEENSLLFGIVYIKGIMKIQRIIFLSCYMAGCILSAQAADNILSLDSCRALAMRNNKELKIQQAEIEKAYYTHQAARTNYYPKFDGMATYTRTGKEISLLNNNQKGALTNWGGKLQGQLQPMLDKLAQDPQFAPLVEKVSPYLSKVSGGLNEAGNSIRDAFRTDTRNFFAAGISLTQPLYMGGKIKAYDRLTGYAEELARLQHSTGSEDLILHTDEAYWQTVSLANKKKLAESYLALVQKLDDDMGKMIRSGVATKSDGLSVDVKVNEAEMKLTQVDNGLSLSKMALCQLCGLDITDSITLADETLDSLTLPSTTEQGKPDIASALKRRTEMKSLDLAQKIYEEKIKVAKSDYLPQVALTAGAFATSPALYNGFEKKFRGNWAVGVLVKVPLWHWKEGFYKVNAAKAEALIARYKTEDTAEKITLQVNQYNYKLKEAAKRLLLAEKNIEKAEENLRTAKLGLASGVISTTNVLEAQTAWASAQSDKIDAQIDMKLAHTYLLKAMGELKP